MEGDYMADKIYDIWAIQHNPDEIYTALDGLEDSEDNTLYSNCISHLQVGNTVLCIQYNTALFNEKNERLVLVMKEGPLTREHFESILAQKNISYSEVVFLPMKTEEEEQEAKEIWFAKDEDVVKDALQDSIEKGNHACEYYPSLKGSFTLQYIAMGDKPGMVDRMIPFHTNGIRGSLVLEDKIILLISNSALKFERFPETMQVIRESGMSPTIIFNQDGIKKEEVGIQYKKER